MEVDFDDVLAQAFASPTAGRGWLPDIASRVAAEILAHASPLARAITYTTN
jgi:hypothetical protein